MSVYQHCVVLFYLGEYLLQSYISNNVSVNEIPLKMKVKLNEFRMQGHDDNFNKKINKLKKSNSQL